MTPRTKHRLDSRLRNQCTLIVLHFGSSTVAERYARFRPAIHDQIIDDLIERLPSSVGRRLALDVGCGTGQGARPLTNHFEWVRGYDLSTAMLEAATDHSQISYQLAAAEQLPDHNATVDLITTGLAFHWFDQECFLAEAWRVLKPGGALAVYNCWLAGIACSHKPLRDWFRTTYSDVFPPPPRGGHGLLARLQEDGAPAFAAGGAHEHRLRVSFCRKDLARYLSTQSNITAAIEAGADPKAIDRWLEHELDQVLPEQLLGNDEMRLPYRGRVEWALKPTNA